PVAHTRRQGASALHVHEVLEDLVGGGDDTAVRLEAALGDDEVGELLREVHVAHLQRTGGQGAPAASTGDADLGDTGGVAGPVGGVACLLQTAGVVEGGDRDLTEDLLEAVGVDAGDDAVAAEREALQVAHRRAVLVGGGQRVGATEVGQPRDVHGDRARPAR